MEVVDGAAVDDDAVLDDEDELERSHAGILESEDAAGAAVTVGVGVEAAAADSSLLCFDLEAYGSSVEAGGVEVFFKPRNASTSKSSFLAAAVVAVVVVVVVVVGIVAAAAVDCDCDEALAFFNQDGVVSFESVAGDVTGADDPPLADDFDGCSTIDGAVGSVSPLSLVRRPPASMCLGGLGWDGGVGEIAVGGLDDSLDAVRWTVFGAELVDAIVVVSILFNWVGVCFFLCPAVPLRPLEPARIPSANLASAAFSRCSSRAWLESLTRRGKGAVTATGGRDCDCDCDGARFFRLVDGFEA